MEMIVGRKNIDLRLVYNVMLKDMNKLVEYVDSLVPPILPMREIIHNQRYYVALQIRKSNELPYALKIKAFEVLTKDINIYGRADIVEDIDELISSCNMTKLLTYLFNEEMVQ